MFLHYSRGRIVSSTSPLDPTSSTILDCPLDSKIRRPKPICFTMIENNNIGLAVDTIQNPAIYNREFISRFCTVDNNSTKTRAKKPKSKRQSRSVSDTESSDSDSGQFTGRFDTSHTWKDIKQKILQKFHDGEEELVEEDYDPELHIWDFGGDTEETTQKELFSFKMSPQYEKIYKAIENGSVNIPMPPPAENTKRGKGPKKHKPAHTATYPSTYIRELYVPRGAGRKDDVILPPPTLRIPTITKEERRTLSRGERRKLKFERKTNIALSTGKIELDPKIYPALSKKPIYLSQIPLDSTVVALKKVLPKLVSPSPTVHRVVYQEGVGYIDHQIKPLTATLHDVPPPSTITNMTTTNQTGFTVEPQQNPVPSQEEFRNFVSDILKLAITGQDTMPRAQMFSTVKTYFMSDVEKELQEAKESVQEGVSEVSAMRKLLERFVTKTEDGKLIWVDQLLGAAMTIWLASRAYSITDAALQIANALILSGWVSITQCFDKVVTAISQLLNSFNGSFVGIGFQSGIGQALGVLAVFIVIPIIINMVKATPQQEEEIKAQYFREYAVKGWASVLGSCKTIVSSLEFFSKWFWTVAAWIFYKLVGRPLVTDEGKDWLEAAANFMEEVHNVGNKFQKRSDMPLDEADRIVKLHLKGEELQRELTALGYTKGNFTGFYKACDSIKKAAKYCKDFLDTADSRYEPLCVHFVGGPAGGKSTGTCYHASIVRDFTFYKIRGIPLEDIPPWNDNMYWERKLGEKFWAGYDPGKFVVGMDDWLLNQDVKLLTERAEELINCVNTNRFCPIQSDSSDKGAVPFLSPMVVLTSNQETPMNPGQFQIQSLEAFLGRIDFTFKVKINPKFLVVNPSNKRQKIDDSKGYNKDAWLYDQVDSITFQTIATDLTPDDVDRLLCARMLVKMNPKKNRVAWIRSERKDASFFDDIKAQAKKTKVTVVHNGEALGQVETKEEIPTPMEAPPKEEAPKDSQGMEEVKPEEKSYVDKADDFALRLTIPPSLQQSLEECAKVKPIPALQFSKALEEEEEKANKEGNEKDVAYFTVTKSLLLKGLAVVGVLCAAVGMYFTYKNITAQWGTGGSSGEITRTVAEKRTVPRPVFRRAQSGAVEIAESMVHKGNTAILYANLSCGDRVHTSATFTHENIGFAPTHFFKEVTEDSMDDILLIANARHPEGKEVQISTLELLEDETRDRTWFRVPHEQPYPDIRKHFITRAEVPRIDFHEVIYVRNEHKNKKFGAVFHQVNGCTYQPHGVAYTGPNGKEIVVQGSLRYPGKYVDGDCNNMILLNANKEARKICGAHVAGRGNVTGWGTIITREDIDEAEAYFNTPRSQNGTEPITKLPLTHWKWVRKHPYKFFQPMKSSIVPGIAHGLLQDPIKGPAVLRPVRRIDPATGDRIVKRPIDVALSEMQFPDPPAPNPDRLREIGDAYSKNWKCTYPVRKLTIDEAINGVENARFIKPIDRKTSCGDTGEDPAISKKSRYIDGPPGQGKPTPVLTELLKTFEDDIRHGRFDKICAVMYLKDELRKLSKIENAQTRLFSAVSLLHLILSKKYFGTFLENIGRHWKEYGIAMGVTPNSWDATDLYLIPLLKKLTQELAGDVPKYDAHEIKQFVDEAIYQINLWHKLHDPEWCPDDDLMRANLIKCATYEAHLVIGDDVVKPNRFLVSGMFLTFVLNSITNTYKIANAHAIHCEEKGFEWTAEMFFTLFYIIAGGDDFLFWHNDETYHFKDMQRIYRETGLDLTPPEKDRDDIDETIGANAFLGRYPAMKNVNGIDVVFWRLPKPTIYEIMNWQDIDLDPIEAFIENARSVLYEMAEYDDEDFEFVKEHINSYAARNAIPQINLTRRGILQRNRGLHLPPRARAQSAREFCPSSSYADAYYKIFNEAPDVAVLPAPGGFVATFEAGEKNYIGKVCGTIRAAKEEVLEAYFRNNMDTLKQEFASVAGAKNKNPTFTSLADKFYHEYGRQPKHVVSRQGNAYTYTLQEGGFEITQSAKSVHQAREMSLNIFYAALEDLPKPKAQSGRVKRKVLADVPGSPLWVDEESEPEQYHRDGCLCLPCEELRIKHIRDNSQPQVTVIERVSHYPTSPTPHRHFDAYLQFGEYQLYSNDYEKHAAVNDVIRQYATFLPNYKMSLQEANLRVNGKRPRAQSGRVKIEPVETEAGTEKAPIDVEDEEFSETDSEEGESDNSAFENCFLHIENLPDKPGTYFIKSWTGRRGKRLWEVSGKQPGGGYYAQKKDGKLVARIRNETRQWKGETYFLCEVRERVAVPTPALKPVPTVKTSIHLHLEKPTQMATPCSREQGVVVLGTPAINTAQMQIVDYNTCSAMCQKWFCRTCSVLVFEKNQFCATCRKRPHPTLKMESMVYIRTLDAFIPCFTPDVESAGHAQSSKETIQGPTTVASEETDANIMTTNLSVVPEVADVDKEVPLYDVMNPYPPSGVDPILARKYRITTFSWSTAAASGTALSGFNLPRGLAFTSQVFMDHIAGFTYFTCDGIELEVITNGTLAHAGLLMIAGLPTNESVTSVTPSTKLQTMWGASTCLTQYLDAGSGMAVKLTIPYVSPVPWITTTQITEDYARLGSVRFFVVTPLMVGSDTGTNTVTVTVFAKFINPRVAGPSFYTAVGSSIFDDNSYVKIKAQSGREQKEKSEKGVVSGVKEDRKLPSLIQQVSDITLGEVAQTALSVLPMLGLNKPISQESVRWTMDTTAPALATGDGLTNRHELSLQHELRLAGDARSYGKFRDERNILSMAQRPGMFKVFSFDSNSTPEMIIAKWHVNPNTAYTEQSTANPKVYNVQHTPCSTAAEQFMFWHGDMLYMIRFVAPMLTTFSVRVSHVMNYSDLPNIGSQFPGGGGDFINEIYDCTGNLDIKIRVPYISTTIMNPTAPPYFKSDVQDSGAICLSIVNKVITTSSAGPTTVWGVVWCAAADNMKFQWMYPQNRAVGFQFNGTGTFPAGTPVAQSGRVKQADFDVRNSVTAIFETGKFPPLVNAKSIEMKHAASGEEINDIYTMAHRMQTGKNYAIPVLKDTSNNAPGASNVVIINPLYDTCVADNINPSWLCWLFRIFLYYRGSIDVNLYPSDNVNGTPTGNIYVSNIRMSSASTYFAFSSATQPYFGQAGVAMENLERRKGIHFNIPYYSNYTFLETRPLVTPVYGTSAAAAWIENQPGTPTSYTFRAFFALGDDFSFGWALGFPMVTYTTP